MCVCECECECVCEICEYIWLIVVVGLLLLGCSLLLLLLLLFKRCTAMCDVEYVMRNARGRTLKTSTNIPLFYIGVYFIYMLWKICGSLHLMSHTILKRHNSSSLSSSFRITFKNLGEPKRLAILFCVWRSYKLKNERERESLVSIVPGTCPQLRTRIFHFVLS